MLLFQQLQVNLSNSYRYTVMIGMTYAHVGPGGREQLLLTT